ncbi:hypothetical protein AU255_15010 [Methyloprofundus sedimenti]|uniref:Uncharacterized protein n=1 Tax=Methyloprofundus sedimenti TaxID=1420851 RepID=A0A1V8M1W2_9GAMM|nr:hypothetical protein [Methyloprofundus sedimenti]OQK15535.1 hypothetical protein AU255_15010 [Methyloprofundus sedimenti]
MYDSIHLSGLKRTFFLSILIISLAACTTTTFKNAHPIDPAQVSKIQFRFVNRSESLGKSLPSADIAQRVAANLVHVGYQISTENNSLYSHDLTAEIGTTKISSTPVGFSFSSGDSDPRGRNFQKANVLPITCTLTSRGPENNQVEYSLDFANKKFLHYEQQPDEQTKLIALLVDDISTTCFNLLSNLKIKTQTRNSMSLIPRATRQKYVSPEPAPSPEYKAPDSPTPNAESQNTDSPAIGSNAASQYPESTNPEPSPEQQNGATPVPDTENQPVATPTPENTLESSWMPSFIIVNDALGEDANGLSADEVPNSNHHRKQIIIHNEGTPVILEMGYDRR